MLRSWPDLPHLAARVDDAAAAVAEVDDAPGGLAGGLDLALAYRRHAPDVARWAQRLAGPGADVEDVVHDVFLVAQKRQRQWRGQAKVSTWLYEITIRVVQQRRRARRRWRFLPFIEHVFDDGNTGTWSQAPAPTPIELLETRVSVALLYELLDKLDEKHRTAIILFELEGLPGREIAALTGTSVANVWVRVMRGRAELSRRLLARTGGDR